MRWLRALTPIVFLGVLLLYGLCRLPAAHQLKIFVQYGYRSVDEQLNSGNSHFGNIPDLVSIVDFGGWTKAKKEIVDGIWKMHVLAKLKK